LTDFSRLSDFGLFRPSVTGQAPCSWSFKEGSDYFLLFGLLFFGYYEFIAPVYGYLGFEWQSDAGKIVESVLLTILLATVLPAHFDKPSGFFYTSTFFAA
jgi:hypothetical protein